MGSKDYYVTSGAWHVGCNSLAKIGMDVISSYILSDVIPDVRSTFSLKMGESEVLPIRSYVVFLDKKRKAPSHYIFKKPENVCVGVLVAAKYHRRFAAAVVHQGWVRALPIGTGNGTVPVGWSHLDLVTFGDGTFWHIIKRLEPVAVGELCNVADYSVVGFDGTRAVSLGHWDAVRLLLSKLRSVRQESALNQKMS